MKNLFFLVSACASLFVYSSGLAQCPTTFYTSTSTVTGGSGSGTRSVSNGEAIVDGNVNAGSLFSSTNTNPGDPAIIFVDLTLSATIPANAFFYLKVSDFNGLTVQAYNGATPINSPAITVTQKTVQGLNFFELQSTQPVTRFRVTFTNSSGQQSRQIYELYAGTPCTNPLPVSLVSFAVKAVDNRIVQIDWATAMERNNDYFVIERSKDLIQFESFAQVKAKEGTQGHTYTYTDESPYAGTSYYRLRQVDLNGTTTAFPSVSVIVHSTGYGVFPNPLTEGRFTLRLDEPQTALVTLYSADGRVLPLYKIGVEDSSLLLKTTKKLPAGVYILTVEERAQIRKHRLVVE